MVLHSVASKTNCRSFYSSCAHSCWGSASEGHWTLVVPLQYLLFYSSPMSKDGAHYSGCNFPYRVGFLGHQGIPENGRVQWMPWALRISLWDIGTYSFVVGDVAASHTQWRPCSGIQHRELPHVRWLTFSGTATFDDWCIQGHKGYVPLGKTPRICPCPRTPYELG